MDVTDGTVAYCEIMRTDYFYVVWSASYDEQEQRLFVNGGKDFSSICIDTRTWTKLLDIPNMLGYDQRTKSVYKAVWDLEQEDYFLKATYFPPADELIEIAREFVGMDAE